MDANTAAMEMWHRAQEQAYEQEEEQRLDIAESLLDSAKKLQLLAAQLERGYSSLDTDHVGEHADWIADSVKALWGDKNA